MSHVERSVFGTLSDGTVIEKYTLTNTNGASASIITYGGIVTALHMPDRHGALGDVVLGFDNLEDYVNDNPYFGCAVGRCGNRTAGASFTLNGKPYQLAANDGDNHLHGGIKGFDKCVWSATANDDAPELELSYTSPDMEEGYPGTLSVKMVYSLTDDNALKVDYTATTDKATVCNLTHHSYFNLNQCKSDVLSHDLLLDADHYTPVGADLIPTGEIAPTKGTPLDFTIPHPVGERINDDFEQLKIAGGYDHNWVMKKQDGQVNRQASIYDPASGRVLEISSNQPGIQVYTGNFLDGSLTGKNGIVYAQRYGICFEPQGYPDAANQTDFPSIVLTPEQTYRHTISYTFSTRDT
jgi:aldose 1-epimerase